MRAVFGELSPRNAMMKQTLEIKYRKAVSDKDI